MLSGGKMSGGSNTDSYVVIFVEVNQSYASSGLGHFGFENPATLNVTVEPTWP